MNCRTDLFLRRFLKDTSGATVADYAMVAVGVAVAITGVTAALGTTAGETYSNIDDAVNY